jgi:hypothetical protein
MRGAGGPLGVSVVEQNEDILEAILSSAQAMGWEHVADTNRTTRNASGSPHRRSGMACAQLPIAQGGDPQRWHG